MKTLTKLMLLGLGLPSALFLNAAELGEPAAPLEVSQWVKGEAVDLAAAKGKKVVVVEFWATWCPPCRVSIPHLSELQKKFEKHDVVIVGVSDEEPSVVKPFIKEQRNNMNYRVALDRAGKTSAGYMERYGVTTIPHAFVVDKEGRVVWHGDPMSGLERVLNQFASNTFDLAVEKKRESGTKKIQQYFEMALKGESDERLDQFGLQIAALDQKVGGINPEEKLDLAELKRTARFRLMLDDYKRAFIAESSEAELAMLAAKAAPLAPKDFSFADFRARFQLQRLFPEYYRAVTGVGDESKAQELAKKLEATPSDDAEVLTQFAKTLLTDPKIKTRNLKLATKLAQAAVDVSEGEDADALETHARALFATGKRSEAIKQQKRAIEVGAKEKTAERESTLKQFQETAVRK